MEEKLGTLEATAKSTAVGVGRSGKIRQKRAVFRDKVRRKIPLENSKQFTLFWIAHQARVASLIYHG